MVTAGQDWMFPSTEQFRMVRCKHCGALYQDIRPSSDEIARFYPSGYAPHATYLSESDTQTRLASFGVLRRVRIVTKYVPNAGRLLDIGCATGRFIAMMRDVAGWQVTGVELNAEAAAAAIQRWGLDVRVGEFLTVSLEPGTFDVVTAWDTLEHLYSPVAALGHIWRLLRPGGVLILRVPHVESVNRWVFGRYWAGWDLPRHLYLFTNRVLLQLLTDAGFSDVRMMCRGGTYPDLMLSFDFWARHRLHESTARTVLTKLARSVVMRVLLMPYTVSTELLRVGAHVIVTARKVPS